jgi:hypothetical protein
MNDREKAAELMRLVQATLDERADKIIDMGLRIRTLEAELAQAKADREVLAKWVRKALKQDDPDGLPFAGDDVHEALSRAGGK